MASGHVNRANRPNTWLHRPATRREDSPCQLGAVHTWHKADVDGLPINVRFRGSSRHREYDGALMTQSGPHVQFSNLRARLCEQIHHSAWRRGRTPSLVARRQPELSECTLFRTSLPPPRVTCSQGYRGRSHWAGLAECQTCSTTSDTPRRPRSVEAGSTLLGPHRRREPVESGLQSSAEDPGPTAGRARHNLSAHARPAGIYT
jgi:hypothetical protein